VAGAGEPPDRAGPGYAPEARIPVPEWRPLDETELAAIGDLARAGKPGNVIRVIPVPAEVTAPYRELGLGSASTEAEAAELLKGGRAGAAERRSVEFARSLLARPDGLECIGCGVRGPGQTTTTFDDAVQRRIGLHVDSWDGWDFAAPGSGPPRRHRLNINVGGSSRHLLFLRVSILDIWQSAPPAARLLPPTRLLQAFLAVQPAVPVYRLEVRPGEAYIAPIEIMPHDATTLGAAVVDASVSVIGHFGPGVPAGRETPGAVEDRRA